MGLAQSKGEPVAMWVLGRRRLGGSLMMVVSGSRRCRGVRDRGKEKKERKRGSLAVRVAGVVEVVDAKVMVDDGEEELARWVLGSWRWLAMVVLWFGEEVDRGEEKIGEEDEKKRGGSLVRVMVRTAAARDG
ncbi:hypothetical protein AHAS_Ahas19G0247500 [Arachis hypogaea]